MNTLRKHYINVGAITPDQPTNWASQRKTLRLDEAGMIAALDHIEADMIAFDKGEVCEIPLDQVPDCVLEYWGIYEY